MVVSALSMRLGQPWEVNDPEHWVIPKAFIFGFELHGVIVGSFPFLIRPTCK